MVVNHYIIKEQLMKLDAINEEQMDSTAWGWVTISLSHHEKNLHLYPYLQNLTKSAPVKDMLTKY